MSSPFITVLSYSGGVQSRYLVERILRDEAEIPLRTLVINADPGMEDERTYSDVREVRRRCQEKGIDFITADGPNLYRDILNLRCNGNLRMDNPPFWTRKEDGSVGRLVQGCTQVYKIAAMRRALRRYMARKYGVSEKSSALRAGLVEMQTTRGLALYDS